MFRLAVMLLLAFMTLPTVVVMAVSFNPTAILSFPPSGLSMRWYVNVITYPQFQRAMNRRDRIPQRLFILAEKFR